LKIENVTFSDAGWYTCIAANTLGTTNESAYLHVVDQLPDDIERIPVNNPHLKTMLTFLSVFVVLSFIIVIVVWKKYSKTKKLQRQIERVNQYTKRVIVVQAAIDNGSTGISESLVSSIDFKI
jgi:fibroblast growth factor receptor 2